MKKFLLALMLLLFIMKIFSQTEMHKEYTKSYYLKKSKNQKTVAWILFGGGTAMTIGGLISLSQSGDFGNIGGPISLGGILADIVSIPFVSSAHKYKKLAASIAITNQKILGPQKNSIGFIAQPAITMRITL